MMLGRGVRGLGADCIIFDLGAVQSAFDVVPFNLFQAMNESSSNGGCMPAYAVGMMPDWYLQQYSRSAGAPGATTFASRTTSVYPSLSTSFQQALTVGMDSSPVAAPSFSSAPPAPLTTSATVSAEPGIMMDTQPQAFTSSPNALTTGGGTTNALTTGGGTPAPAGSSAAASASASVSFLGGIDSKYLIIGAVAAFFMFGRK